MNFAGSSVFGQELAHSPSSHQLITVYVLFSFEQIFNEFKNKYSHWKPPSDAVVLVPTDCRGARGVKSELDTAQLNALNNAKGKLATSENKAPEAAIQNYDYVKSREDSHCWYELPKFRALFPAFLLS